MKSLVLVILLGWVFFAPASGATLGTDNDGVTIDAGGMGTFNMGYPELDGRVPRKIIAKNPAGKTATITYDDGATLQVDVRDPGQILYTFAGVPSDVKQVKVSMTFDFSYQQGGKWRIDSAGGDFLSEKPAKPHLYQGNATTFELTNAQGETLSLRTPDWGYLELTDNREWNWPVYGYQAHFSYHTENPTYKIAVSSGMAAGVKAGPIVDAFGQIKNGDWPGKIKSADELAADVASEKVYYAGLPQPDRDTYGGLPGTKEKLGLTTSGFFHVEKKGEKWILVDPAGNAFFQLGVCCFAPGDDYTLVAGRESAFEWLPPLESEDKTAYQPGAGSTIFSFHLANMIRKYGTPYSLEDFQARMIERVRKFGFNSIGAFSPVSPAVKAANFPYVAHLPLAAWGDNAIRMIPGIRETWDPFDPVTTAQVDKNLAGELPAKANDPLLIGYFQVNEPAYEDIPKVVPGLKGGEWACKRELVRQLADKYKTIDAFNTAWGTVAKSFDDLNDMAMAATTKEAADDMHAYTGNFLETYYKLVSETFHKYDTHHLLLGSRLQPVTIKDEQLCRIAGKYLDVMSFNYYTNGVDKDWLKRIYGWSGRPILLSEFYWSSPGDSGLVGGSEVGSQQKRGLAYRNYVEQAASLGYVVGTEWFTLVDQASTGRWFSKYTGERANTGLFSVADRPYQAALAEMAKANDDVYEVWLDGKTPYVFDDPKFGNSQTVEVGTPGLVAPSTLKEVYGKMFALGTAFPGASFSDAEQKLLLANFTNITPENCMKPQMIEPAEGQYTFEEADATAAFAQKNGLTINGHCLVWHQECPDWFFLDNGRPAGRDLVLKRMIDHITAEVSHFRGKVFSWDVVNEALGNGSEYLWASNWEKAIGDDYVAEAFRAAQKADPEPELYYNDYNIELPAKRAKAIRLIRDLKKQNIRIDGIGIQGHWELDKIPYQDIEDSIIAFHNEGVKVMITELDLDVVPRYVNGADAGAHQAAQKDPYPDGCPPGVLQRQAEQYGKLFALFAKHADAISRVTFWGLDDAHSWLNGWPGKRTNYPLLWDRNLQPKPALAAVLNAAKGTDDPSKTNSKSGP